MAALANAPTAGGGGGGGGGLYPVAYSIVTEEIRPFGRYTREIRDYSLAEAGAEGVLMQGSHNVLEHHVD